MDKYPPSNEQINSRRDFLTKSINTTVSTTIVTISSILIMPGPIKSIVSLINEAKNIESSLEDSSISEEKRVWVRTKKENFVNIGVQHISSDFERQLRDTSLGNEIKNADIVLLESRESEVNDNTNDANYFEKLKIYAEEHKKIVVGIDKAHGKTMELTVIGSTFAPLIFIKKIFGKDIVGVGEDRKKTHINRRKYLQNMGIALGIGQLGIMAPSSIYSKQILKNTDELYQDKYDFSLVGDARTSFMTNQVLQCIEKYPNKKIIVITGDYHATGINYYMNNRSTQQKMKNTAYNIIYGIFKILP